MSKKVCLNLLLSVYSEDAISLYALPKASQLASELKIKAPGEITDLENKALKTEAESIPEAFSLWLKTLYLKLGYFKGSIEKVQKQSLQFLSALTSQIILQLSHNHASKTGELLGILANLSHKKYRIPENERLKCKIRYYIYLSQVYLLRSKFKECCEQVNLVIDKTKDPFDKMCCFNVLSLAMCKQGQHQEALKYHQLMENIYKTSNSNPVIDSIVYYNFVVENLHLEEHKSANLFAQKAFQVAEANKSSRNLIFSKVLLLYQELFGKEMGKKIKSQTSKNALKKKTLDYMMKPTSDEYILEIRTYNERRIKDNMIRGRALEIEENVTNSKIISLGSKMTKKKRSKTENTRGKKKKLTERDMVVQKFMQMEAAKKIQKAWRQFIYRRNEAKKKKSNQAATKIQKSYRMFSQKKQYKKTRKGIVKIQANIRRHLYQKTYKLYIAASKKVQGFVKTLFIRANYLYKKRSITKIQALVKSFLVRRLMQKMQKAAKVIQKQARVKIFKLYLRKSAKFRKFVERLLLRNLCIGMIICKPIKTKENILDEIKEECSGQTASISFEDILPVIKVQSIFRMALALLRYRKQQYAVKIISRYVRGYLTRKHLLRSQRAAKKIQHFFNSKKTPEQLETDRLISI
ncbi:hypothetical protein SteCoe_5119 [Stentor coeruleus]|uniref:Uncharacterized protein n=1 Tax=Stentor coeruleus TaxID=5963 RepID=A0A1R2CT04_9CILI|nr:hypothetical protein SteCoe_5119 [Stentor coeruleus]